MHWQNIRMIKSYDAYEKATINWPPSFNLSDKTCIHIRRREAAVPASNLVSWIVVSEKYFRVPYVNSWSKTLQN